MESWSWGRGVVVGGGIVGVCGAVFKRWGGGGGRGIEGCGMWRRGMWLRVLEGELGA